MRKHDAKTIVFNLSGATVISVAVLYIVHDFLVRPAVLPCSQRYAASQQFGISGRTGRPMSPIELQARVGIRESGILQNAAVTTNPDIENSNKIDVKLAKLDDEDVTAKPANGISFLWPVASVAKVEAVCVSYDVMLPEKMKPGFRIRLPGVAATGAPVSNGTTGTADTSEPLADVALNIGVSEHGEAGVEMNGIYSQSQWLSGKRTVRWPRGNWVRVEQEVILNEAGKENGTIRFWLNGALVVDNSELMLRRKSHQRFRGLSADTLYTQGVGDPVTVSMSPFTIQWQKIE